MTFSKISWKNKGAIKKATLGYRTRAIITRF